MSVEISEFQVLIVPEGIKAKRLPNGIMLSAWPKGKPVNRCFYTWSRKQIETAIALAPGWHHSLEEFVAMVMDLEPETGTLEV